MSLNSPDTADPTTTAFAEAVAAKDFSRIGDLLHPEIDFRAMTPNRIWEAPDAQRVVADVFRTWWDDDEIEEFFSVETDAFADVESVRYRYRGRAEGGPFVSEQQVYLRVREGRIHWMRIICTGQRSLAAAPIR
jgi:ketosteroid isomerase-like protein